MTRQYTGTTGKIDNCRLGVFLAYASCWGRALVDRELYLPAGGTEDRDRCQDAGIPDEVGFATKPQLSVAMLARAQRAGVLSGWVTADELYGQNPAFRTWLIAIHTVQLPGCLEPLWQALEVVRTVEARGMLEAR